MPPPPSSLLSRALGILPASALARQESASQFLDIAAAGWKFDGSGGGGSRNADADAIELGDSRREKTVWAHRTGVNAIDIEGVEGRL